MTVPLPPGEVQIVLPVKDRAVGNELTVKLLELVAVPLGVITLIGPVVAPAGNVAVICVELFTVYVADWEL